MVRVWLFGSRARGSATPQSDYDFAIELEPTASPAAWGQLAGDLREDNPRLNTLDLVRWDEASDLLRAKVLSEGKVIYEKT